MASNHNDHDDFAELYKLQRQDAIEELAEAYEDWLDQHQAPESTPEECRRRRKEPRWFGEG